MDSIPEEIVTGLQYINSKLLNVVPIRFESFLNKSEENSQVSQLPHISKYILGLHTAIVNGSLAKKINVSSMIESRAEDSYRPSFEDNTRQSSSRRTWTSNYEGNYNSHYDHRRIESKPQHFNQQNSRNRERESEYMMSEEEEELRNRINLAAKRESSALREVEVLTQEMREISSENRKIRSKLRNIEIKFQQEMDELATSRNELKDEKERERNARYRAAMSEARAVRAERRLERTRRMMEELQTEKRQKEDMIESGDVLKSREAFPHPHVHEKSKFKENHVGHLRQEKSTKNAVESEKDVAVPQDGGITDIDGDNDVTETSSKKKPLENKHNRKSHTEEESGDDIVDAGARIVSLTAILIFGIAGTACGVGSCASVAYIYRKNRKLAGY